MQRMRGARTSDVDEGDSRADGENCEFRGRSRVGIPLRDDDDSPFGSRDHWPNPKHLQVACAPCSGPSNYNRDATTPVEVLQKLDHHYGQDGGGTPTPL